MKNLFKIFLITALALNSCSKDNNDTIEDPTINQELLKSNLINYSTSVNSTNQDQTYLNNLDDCFSFIYPFNVVIDGEEVLVNSAEELSTLPEFEFQFPFSVLVDDGITVVNNDDDFFMIIQTCFGDINDPNNTGYCFVLIFPLNAIDCSGNEVLLNSEEELYSNCINDLIFPVMVTLENGPDIIINNGEEFDALYNECNDIDSCEDCAPTCFEIIFPMSFIVSSGEVVDVNNEDELYSFLENQNDDYIIAYPINVELENGASQTINNDLEFETLFQSCN